MRSDRPHRSPDRRRLAPSIQRAHRRVLFAYIASAIHGVLLAGLGGFLLFIGEPAWVRGPFALLAAVAIPLLGRAAYRGNSFAALLLLLSALAPPLGVLLAGGDPVILLGGLALVPFYFVGAKGAIGLRGRRGSKR